MRAVAKKTTRASQRDATREAVIAAASKLFSARGYDDVTIRDIAELADVSVGTVIAAGGSKADLFNEATIDDYTETARHMLAGANSVSGSTLDRLTAAMEAAFHYQLGQVEMVRSSFINSWVRSKTADRLNRTGLALPFAVLTDILHDGMLNWEVSPDIDKAMAAELILAIYLSNYRRALYGDWDAPRLTALFREQMQMLFKGLGLK